jgi:hypothetical protein
MHVHKESKAAIHFRLKNAHQDRFETLVKGWYMNGIYIFQRAINKHGVSDVQKTITGKKCKK